MKVIELKRKQFQDYEMLEIGLGSKAIPPDELINNFREKTGLPIRKILVISGVNKIE